MYLSIPIITLLLNTTLGAFLKRQKDSSDCIISHKTDLNQPGKLSQFLALLKTR
jgi:hypothetical protein